MFMGQCLCLILFFIKTRNHEKRNIYAIHPLVYAFPASLDICASTLGFIGLGMCASSIYQMTRGFIVVVTAIIGRLYLQKILKLHHWVSMCCIVIAITIVGMVGFLNSKDQDKSLDNTSPFGIFLILIGQVF